MKKRVRVRKQDERWVVVTPFLTQSAAEYAMRQIEHETGYGSYVLPATDGKTHWTIKAEEL